MNGLPESRNISHLPNDFPAGELSLPGKQTFWSMAGAL